jgi:phenylalanyl-tRNA synthetase alpha chain
MQLEEIKEAALTEIREAENAAELEKIRIFYLGRRAGKLTEILRSLKELPIEKRREIGPKAQALKQELEGLFEKKVSSFPPEARLAKGGKLQTSRRVDWTAPGKRFRRGHLHPLTLVEQEIRKIFLSMNFSVVEGPEAESEYYNFDALNIPQNHPAREAWDTFWLKPENPKSKIKNQKLLLRTHTSPVQLRYMEKNNPPFQIVVPGRVFRYEATDASHEINFYQLEGLMVGKNVNLANFKFVVQEFFQRFFAGRKIDFRYRPSYFPFVEPGLEVDILLKDKTQNIKPKWLEVMGAGMVHPRVFEYAHYNPRDWQGFAFGMGIDRLAMIKYKIPDIRLFYSGDLRFIHQF